MQVQNCPFRAARKHVSGLLIEPYRPFFFFGVIYSVFVMGLWFSWLHGLNLHRVFFSLKASPVLLHFHWMIFGFPSFYIMGFLATAFPKWVNAPQPKGPANLLFAASFFLVQLLILLGGFVSVSLLKIGLLLETMALLFFLQRLVSRYQRSPERKLFDQSSLVLVALSFAVIAQVLFQLALSFGQARYYPAALYLAKYPYLLFLMMAVSYRILPFFTSRIPPETPIVRGTKTLKIMLGLILLLGVADFIPRLKVVFLIEGLICFLLGALWLAELIRWNVKKACSNFLLFSHYVAFFWAIGFLWLRGIQLLFAPSLLTGSGASVAIEHLFFIGAISGLVLGISTRVTRGHGGLGFVLGKIDFAAFGLLQVATLVRVVLPLFEMRFSFLAGQSFHAAFLWWLVFLLWGIRYVPALVKRPAA